MAGTEELAEATLQASRALLGVVVRSLEPALEKVSVPQYRVLVLLVTNGPMRSGVVAERMGVHPSTFSRNADRLVAGGWARRVEDPDSRQFVRIEVTEEGRRLVDAVTRRRREELAAVLGQVPEGRRQGLVVAFRTFAEAAGEPGPDELTVLGM